MNEQIKNFFKIYLDNTICIIRSGGIHVEKTIEGKCHLKFENNYGLGIYSSLEYNSGEVGKQIHKLIEDKNIFPYGEILDYLHGDFIKEINKIEIQLGRIYPFNIKSIQSNFDKEKLRDCKIIYENGTICELINIQPYDSH